MRHVRRKGKLLLVLSRYQTKLRRYYVVSSSTELKQHKRERYKGNVKC